MTSRTLLSTPYIIDIPIQERSKPLVRVLLEKAPLSLDKGLQFREELFDRIKVWRVGRQIYKLDAGVSTHLLKSFSAMEGCIVYYQYRVRLRPPATVVEELFNEVLKHGTICASLKHTRKKNAVLRIYGQDLVPLLTLILSNFDRCHSNWGPPCPSESDAFITARLIYVYEIIRGV